MQNNNQNNQRLQNQQLQERKLNLLWKAHQEVMRK